MSKKKNKGRLHRPFFIPSSRLELRSSYDICYDTVYRVGAAWLPASL